MRIQELERIVGIDRATIRFYEKEGLIAPKRLENGYRDYTQENAEELKKIWLLRQLDVSIFRIRLLQQGSGNFSQTLSEQIRILSDRIAEKKRAKAVCQAIIDDGSEYRTMDADHYLQLMREIRIDQQEMKSGSFHEDLSTEIHPWRRWLARVLDYAVISAVMQFLVIVVFRVRPVPEGFSGVLFDIMAGFLFAPVEAFLLSRWGTTAGKLVMGIRIEYIDGGNLSFRTALNRAWLVFQAGMGFCIPFVEPCVQIYRYCKLTGRTWHRFARYDQVILPEEMPWDEESEIIYSGKSGKRGAAAAVVLAFLILLGTITGLDSFKPKYRGRELSIAQFSENYNSYISIIHDDVQVYDKLRSDGTKESVPPGVVVFDFSGNQGQEFQYETENGILQAVSISNSWEDVFYLDPINGDALDVAASLLMAQDGCGIVELWKFLNIWSVYEEQDQAQFTYENLEISWTIDAENCRRMAGAFFSEDETLPSYLNFAFSVRILQ